MMETKKVEMEDSEYLHSAVEDSVLNVVLSFYSHLPIIEALEIKDKLLYEGEETYQVMPNAGFTRNTASIL